MQGNDLDLASNSAASSGKTKRSLSGSDSETEEVGVETSEGGGRMNGKHSTEKKSSGRHTSRGTEGDKDDWEWLLTASTKTYACTGIFRSACWLLSEVSGT